MLIYTQQIAPFPLAWGQDKRLGRDRKTFTVTRGKFRCIEAARVRDIRLPFLTPSGA